MWADTEHLRSAIVGIGSLLFLIGFSKTDTLDACRSRATMGSGTCCFSAGDWDKRYRRKLFGPKYLVNIPADWMGAWRLPDFQEFKAAPLGAAILTFIASIESLLSIKEWTN